MIITIDRRGKRQRSFLFLIIFHFNISVMKTKQKRLAFFFSSSNEGKWCLVWMCRSFMLIDFPYEITIYSLCLFVIYAFLDRKKKIIHWQTEIWKPNEFFSTIFSYESPSFPWLILFQIFAHEQRKKQIRKSNCSLVWMKRMSPLHLPNQIHSKFCRCISHLAFSVLF